jgi:beta-lactamase class A
VKARSFIIVLVFIAGVGAGVLIDHFLVTSPVTQHLFSDAHQVRQGGYSLINPLLECEIGGDRLSKQFTSFRYQLEREVDSLKATGKIEGMSVYFRDLNNGSTIGVNQDEGFTPASLLKLPILMAYLKQSESDKSILKKTYPYTDSQDRNVSEHVKPKQPMVRGQVYTVEDLLHRLIVFSDNNALFILVDNLPLSVQDKVYTDLGITIPGVRGSDDFMSVKDYASFFRILYNASYLSKDSSQKALSLLSEVDFTDGLRGGVPKDVPVANKFGERQAGTTQQLHDCGIVYLQDHPYLLCIMSRGSDFDELASSIKTVSRLVYTEVSKQEHL